MKKELQIDDFYFFYLLPKSLLYCENLENFKLESKLLYFSIFPCESKIKHLSFCWAAWKCWLLAFTSLRVNLRTERRLSSLESLVAESPWTEQANMRAHTGHIRHLVSGTHQCSQNVDVNGPHHRCFELIVSSSFNQPMAVERRRSHELIGSMVGTVYVYVLRTLARTITHDSSRPTLYLTPIFYSFDALFIWLLTYASLQFNVL